MSEMETEVKRGRGRPKADPNAPKRAKKPAKGRKYFVRDAAEYEAFIAGMPMHESLDAAMTYADGLATEAENSGNPNLRLAVFEEAGILSAAVERKVVRNFASSRTLTRQASPEGANAAQGAQQGSETSDGHSPAGPAPTSESTPSESPTRSRRGR